MCFVVRALGTLLLGTLLLGTLLLGMSFAWFGVFPLLCLIRRDTGLFQPIWYVLFDSFSLICSIGPCHLGQHTM
jgi:hypothetical protein